MSEMVSNLKEHDQRSPDVAGGVSVVGNAPKTLGERIRAHAVLYLLFTPVLLYFVLIRFWPIALSVIVSFKDLRLGLGIWNSPWIGFQNFQKIFSDPEILNVIKNTIEISLLRLGVGFIPPIFLAIMFHDMNTRWFKRTTQTIVYIPHFLSWVVIYGLVFALFATGTGFINNVIRFFGGDSVEFLLNKRAFRPLLVGSALWKGLGWGTIIYLAALSGVDPGLYEAAIIDGAGPLKRIRHITFPSILPVVTFVFTITLGFLLFAGGEQVLLFYNYAVYDVADIIDTWIYRVGLSRFQLSIGTAMGFIQSTFGMVLLIVANYLARRYTDRGIW